MVVQVTLHTTLQIQTPEGPVGHLPLALPEYARVQDVLDRLDIQLGVEHMLLVVNRQIVEPEHPLHDGDQVDLIPAMSGGAPG